MQRKYFPEWILYITVAIICLLFRLYLLPQTGLTDYDSVRNWEIVQEIGQGDFSNIFHHASPGFYIFFALFTPLFSRPLGFIFINLLFNVASVLLAIRFFRKNMQFPMAGAFLTGLLFGFSVFMVSTARNFATESISIFLFMLILDCYYRRLIYQNPKALLQAIAWLALGLTINYKLLLVLPVLLVLEFLQRGDTVLTGKTILKAGLILLSPILAFMLVAICLDQPFYKFPASIVSINNFTRATPAGRTGRFNLDLHYYGRYIWDFEWPLILPGIFLFPILFRKYIFSASQPIKNSYQYIFWVVFLFLAGMHLLVKAPRGLLFIYSLLYGSTYLVLQHLIKSKWILYIILISSIFYQVYQVNKYIYSYSRSNYPTVVNYLKQQHISKVATTVGRNIIPHSVNQNIEVMVILSETELPALKKQGFKYVLLDEYYLAANVQKFNSLRILKPEAIWFEPPLLSPFLYLDHAEFNGLTYHQAMENHQHNLKDNVQLQLIRIP